ncbi:MAG: hypothetical protein AB7U73_02735 [Pirellulales bacterium]
MKAEPFVRAPLIAQGVVRTARGLLLAGSLSIVVFLTTIALLVERRLAGVLSEPLPARAFLAIGLLLMFLAGASAVTFAELFGSSTRLRRSIKPLLIGLAFAGLLAIAIPGTGALALAVGGAGWLATAAVVLAGEQFARWFVDRSRWNLPRRIKLTSGSVAAARPRRAKAGEAKKETEIVQHLVRRQLGHDGRQQVDGWLRCDFEPGQRTAVAHVAFCPPLPTLPNVEARLVTPSAADGACKVAELYAHGARFEVRLSTPPRAATTARVEFTAIAEPPPTDDSDRTDADTSAETTNR